MSEEMKQEISEIEGRLGRIETNVGVLMTDVGTLKSETGALKSDVGELKAVTRRIATTVVSLAGKLDTVIERMATKDDIGVLNRRMDGFAGQLDDMRFRWTVHADTLAKHDKRLKKLESRRA